MNYLKECTFTQHRETDVNATLNYGYAIMRAQMARIISWVWLNPLIGIFHKNEYNQFNFG